MNTSAKGIIWQQFGAAIDMLHNALRACPDELWQHRLWDDPSESTPYSEFWFLAYHTLYWLDLFLSGSVEEFTPPERFKRDREAPGGGLPQTPYTRDELEGYLAYCRRKCRATFEALTDEAAWRLCRFEWIELPFLELQLYSMRHVQEHAAQLSLMIGQHGAAAPDWVARAGSEAA